MRLTVTLSCAVPPVPVQLKVKVVAVVSAPVLWLPAVTLLPLQPPDAVHDVASVVVHVKVLLAPLATVVGAADNVTVGAGVELVTEMEALAWPEPPPPVQLSVNVASAFNAPVLSLPAAAFAPLQAPDAVHVVALVLDQFNVLAPPALTVNGLAVSVTTGAGAGPPPPSEPPPPPQDTSAHASASCTIRKVNFMAAIIRNRPRTRS